MTKIIAFASGKGGVGKTSMCLNMATILAKKGKRVLVFDGDFGLANADVQLGVTPNKDLSDVLRGQATLEDIMVKSEKGIFLIPGRSGASNLPFMNQLEQKDLLKQLRALAGSFDVVFIDVPAGLDTTVLGLCGYADETLVVATPDPSAITDAYALIKLLYQRQDYRHFNLLMNQAGNITEGKAALKKITVAADKFLGLTVPVLGQIPYDRQYSHAVKSQQLCCQSFPTAKATQAMENLALLLLP